ncbi:pre-mRNA-splicing factor SLU7-like [Ceratina calcarata]|uniref:Pre-mRNA-splicing factor SLU7 n=1 Tax=Ceratina calcarata TaxID=156304 RepID=A0AAJ7J7B0_9HYME|nr:pre-mRNA-splicing factor SLU7-like [Ceratina calcarata]
MANTLANVPVSKIIKNKSNFEDEPRKKSREDWRKAKELEEARKAGTAPAAVDEEGKDINPHIPQYISATPWYFGAQGPTLKHQRPQPEKQKQFSDIDEWYRRGVDSSKVATKYRKGACDNCGAMTHKKKECMERPRKIGAKYTNANIAPDEFTQPDLSMDYDGKRDRWAGYDPSQHRAIVEENDPKTRSMRDNPYAGTEREVDYKGENFARFSGDTQQHANAQLFAWEAHERGVDVHLLAEPTKLELLKQEYDKKRDELKDKARGSIINRYGGEEHLDAPPPSLLLAQTEQYVEYSRYGKIIKGQDRQVIRSKYEEDVYPNNHTCVWGSYWQAGKWGYKCCHSFVKNSYCTGNAGKKAAEAAVAEIKRAASEEEDKSDEEEKAHSSDEGSSSSDSCSDEQEQVSRTIKKSKASKRREKKQKQKEKRKNKKKAKQEQDKLQQALHKEEERRKEAERLLQIDERKRPYNSMYEAKEPSAEEIEAFQMKRMREEDPMAEFLAK